MRAPLGRAWRWVSAIALPSIALALPATFAAAPGAALAGPPAASASASASASAAAKDATKPADKKAAQKLLAQGNQLVGEGDYLGALDRFRGAYDKFPSPKILLNIGTTLRQLGRNVEAAEVYEHYLADPERDAAREKDVQRVLGEIDAVVGHLVITVDDAAASLRLDGKPIEPLAKGQSRRVEPGEHTVTAEKPGVAPVVQSIMVKARQEHLVTLQFAPPPPKVEPPPPQSNTQRTLGLALGGVGAVTIIAGAVLGFVAIAQTGSAAAHCYEGGRACDQKGIELDQGAKTSATISSVGFAVGAGILGAGALIWLTSPAPPKEAPVKERSPAPATGWISVEPRTGGAAFCIGGAF